MRGGKLTCNRKETDESGCVTLSCVDYEKKIFNSFDKTECAKRGWKEYYDDVAKGRYWYNWDTGEATWISPLGGGRKKTRRQHKIKNKVRTLRRKTRRCKKKKSM
jgi:hypothetical protein